MELSGDQPHPLVEEKSLVSTQRWNELNSENDRLTRELDELRLVHSRMIDPGEFEVVKLALTALQIKCGFCICGDGATDECCPQCIPGVPTDIFQRYEAAVKLIETVRRVGKSSAFISVFQCADNHHAGYRGESWKQEMDDFDRACGKAVASEPSVTVGTGNSGEAPP